MHKGKILTKNFYRSVEGPCRRKARRDQRTCYADGRARPDGARHKISKACRGPQLGKTTRPYVKKETKRRRNIRKKKAGRGPRTPGTKERAVGSATERKNADKKTGGAGEK